jgi:hypothetical protein
VQSFTLLRLNSLEARLLIKIILRDDAAREQRLSHLVADACAEDRILAERKQYLDYVVHGNAGESHVGTCLFFVYGFSFFFRLSSTIPYTKRIFVMITKNPPGKLRWRIRISN